MGAEHRRLAEQSLDEILVLARKKAADHETLIQRLEALHGPFRAFFARDR